MIAKILKMMMTALIAVMGLMSARLLLGKRTKDLRSKMYGAPNVTILYNYIYRATKYIYTSLKNICTATKNICTATKNIYGNQKYMYGNQNMYKASENIYMATKIHIWQ